MNHLCFCAALAASAMVIAVAAADNAKPAAADQPTAAPQRPAIPFADQYEARAWMPYRLLKPKDYDPQRSYPLVLFLHGMGERGSDNQAQLINGVSEFFATDEARAKYPCFAVVPQCPGNDTWANWRKGGTELTRPARAALDIVEAVQQEFSVDPARLYIGGLSMGGFGAWAIIAARPQMFAAAFPICGGGDPSQAARLVNVAIWAFHGAQDDVVNPEMSRAMIAAIQQAGGSPKYTEYAGVGHGSWVPALKEPGLLEWLFAQKRGGRYTTR
jgi:predicted peptidase